MANKEASSVLAYAIVLQDFSVTLYYTPQRSNITLKVTMKTTSGQYPADPRGWHYVCAVVIDKEFSYFLDSKYIGSHALTNPVVGTTGVARIGQMLSGIYEPFFVIARFFKTVFWILLIL